MNHGWCRAVVFCALACTAEAPGAAGHEGRPSADAVGAASAEGSPAGSAQAPSQPCGDGVCDAPEQADASLCPRDCEARPAAGDDWCGDGLCDALEEAESSCPEDCAEKAAAKAAKAAAAAARAAADPDVITSGLAPGPGKVENPPPPALSPPLDHSAVGGAADPKEPPSDRVPAGG